MKVKPNYSQRTFTIYKNGSKYRTCKFIRFEFEDNLHNTEKDWIDFLKQSQSYYLVK